MMFDFDGDSLDLDDDQIREIVEGVHGRPKIVEIRLDCDWTTAEPHLRELLYVHYELIFSKN